MKWRCEWCGKPHEVDDPPCDNCGHSQFEKAIVRQTAPDEDRRTTTVWVCPDCGREHPKNSPPCSRCASGPLQRQEKYVDEDNLTDAPTAARDVGPAHEAETTTVYVCEDCDREHVRKNPPCSRCGGSTLVAHEKRVADEELTVPGYLDVLTPQYAVALGALAIVVSIFVLGLTGMADVPGFSGSEVPDVEDVPGNESMANGIDHATVEDAYVEALNDRRSERGVDRLERSSDLDDIATYYNQHRVKELVANGDGPDRGTVDDLLDDVCSGDASVALTSRPYSDGTDARSLGEELANSLASGTDWTVRDGNEKIGVDAHSADGAIFITHFECQ